MTGKDEKMEELFQSARKKMDAVAEKMRPSVPHIFRDREAVGRAMDALEGEEADFCRARMGLERVENLVQNSQADAGGRSSAK